MRIMIVVLAITFTFAGVAYAQVGTTEEKPAVPASQEDIRKLQNEIRRLRLEASAAEKNSTARSAEERQKIIAESTTAISATEKKLADKLEAMKAETIAREARKASEDQLRRERIAWFSAGAAVLTGMLIPIILFARKSRKKSKEGMLYGRIGSADSISVQSGPEKVEVLRNPEISDLEDFSRRNGGIKKIPFILLLQEDGGPYSGRPFNCLAELVEGSPPLVYIDGSTVPVTWRKRRSRAVQSLSKANIHIVA